MFQATIVNTKSWKNSIEAIVALIDEGTLQLDESGMKLRAMDPSQIALVDFFLPAESFEKYKVDKPVNIGINFLELSKITKRLKSDDTIELSLESRIKMVFEIDFVLNNIMNPRTLESAYPSKQASNNSNNKQKISGTNFFYAFVSGHITWFI